MAKRFINIYPKTNVLTPSKKLNPFIMTNMQIHKKIILKTLNSKKVSNQSIEILSIDIFPKSIKTNIVNDCKIILFNGELKKSKSDITPIR